MEPAEPRHQSDIDIASTGPYLLETLLKASLTKRPNVLTRARMPTWCLWCGTCARHAIEQEESECGE